MPVVKNVIDPLTSPRLALSGRVVTMDASHRTIEKGTEFLEKGGIVAVQAADAAPPAGFEGVKRVLVGGTLYPGLIELHNHLAYNALRLWQVPKKYANRDEWGGKRNKEYRPAISGPMTVLGKSPGLLPALIRYVEAKCLVAGVTTSQGIELFSNRGARRYYRGIVRNVENTEDSGLPDASAKISDMEAANARKFLAKLQKETCFLLHLSEGTNAAARAHFKALEFAPSEWAVSKALAGIHCAALTAADLDAYGSLKGALIWSPLSNLLLYGKTARVADAKRFGVRIGLGSDWSPTGSKNLLGELKVARLASSPSAFSDADLVDMVTRTAASILGWDAALGSLEAGKRADLIAVTGASGDPYGALIAARETDVRLVVIGGGPRFGLPSLFTKPGTVAKEKVRIGGNLRALNLDQADGDVVVGGITLDQARDTLRDALDRLPDLAHDLENQPHNAMAVMGGGRLTWSLALDEIEETGMEVRPRLRTASGRPTGPRIDRSAVSAVPLSTVLKPLELDPLTVADDHDFLDTVELQRNLPAAVRTGLRGLY
jgi:cytosine/adenosine deaminase-related metal-dependent hydrolase